MAKDIWALLRRKYPENEYALMAEVRDAAGFHASRSADFIAVNLWPSRGLAINGIELKSFRGDWLNELKKPKKAENIFKFCDYFWLLTTDDTVAKLEEIPVTWGWMCIKGERILIKKDAPKLTPEPVDRHFVCSMLKRASDKSNFVHIDSINDKIDAARESGKNENARRLDHLEKELKEITDHVNEFHKTSGINLKSFYRWQTSPAKIGEAVKFIENGGGEALKKELLDLEQKAKNIYDSISNGIKLFE